MSDRYTKMAAWRRTTAEMVHFVMDILGNGVESNNENMFREERDAESDPADVSGSDSHHLEAKKGKRGERTRYIH